MQPSRDVLRLVEIMAALRDPRTGCPWDVEQSFETIAPYPIEEAYEVSDAIERRDAEDLREELGDLLLQVVYHAQLAEEAGLFAFADVVEGITTKMIRRHPHVFGDETARSARSAKGQWERIKAEEKAEKARRRAMAAVAHQQAGGLGGSEGWTGAPVPRTSAESAPLLLSEVPPSFPALTLALKVQGEVAKVGFDWVSEGPIRAKIAEEIAEFDEALAAEDGDEIEAEFGDVLFSLVNLARFHGIDPEKALRRCVRKFRDRFDHIERRLAARTRTLDEASLEEMEALWVEAKALGRAAE